MLKQPASIAEQEKPRLETLSEINPAGFNPFPGLRPFTIDECHLFFGREGQVDEILVKLAKNRFVSVMGYSGSGKSSLMYCGLIPVLYGGFVTETGPGWHVIVSRPATSPVRTLAASIAKHLVAIGRIEESDRQVHESILSSVLRSSPEGLVEVCRYLQQNGDENVFLLVDQFEELLRLKNSGSDEDSNEAQIYVNLILTAIKQRAVPIYVSITMRSDFIGDCAVFPGLTKLINHSNYLVPQMTREQKRMIIEGPVGVGGGKISDRLVRKLLNEVGDNQDQLPILQHALMRTWDYWIETREPGEPIDIRHYQAVGRMSEALSLHANEAFDELTTRQKEIAEVLFKNITEKNQETQMRRPGKLSVIARLAEASESDVIEVVENFRKSGRSLLMPGVGVPLHGDSMIELSHESLMRIWKRLNQWVEEEFESAQMYKRLSDAAGMYQIGKTGLWRPPDLQLALNWQKKQRPTREWAQRYDVAFERAIVFLDTSRITYEAELKNQEMMQRRVLRRARATALILGFAFIIAVAFFIFSYVQRREAERQRLIAEKNAEEAVLQQENAEKQAKIAQEERDKADALRRSAEDLNKQLQESYSNLEIAVKNEEEARRRAETLQGVASVARDSAIASRKVAEQKRMEAEKNYKDAQRLLYLNLAQSLEGSSMLEDDDKELAGLLAMQGYVFHRRYEGKKHDRTIYEGLYTALAKLNNGASYNAIKLQGPPHVHVKSLALSSQGTSFYTSGADGRILKSDFKSQNSQATGYATPYPSKVIALSSSEKYLVNGSDSSFVQIFELASDSKTPSATIRKLGGSTNDIKFIQGQEKFIISSATKALWLGDAVEGTARKILDLPVEFKKIDISPDGAFLIGATHTGKIFKVDLKSMNIESLIEENGYRIWSVKFSPDGKSFAYGMENIANTKGFVKIYSIANRTTKQFAGHRSGVSDIEFSPDGTLLATAGLDRRLILWVLDSPEDIPIVMDENGGFIWDIAFSSDSKYLIAACSESEIRVWPTDPSLLASQICPKLNRNMTLAEWKKYVARENEGVEKEDKINYEATCVGILVNDF